MVQSTPNPSTLARLNAFDATARGRALQRLLQEQSEANATPDRVANMHCHSFYSYSGYGYSPSALAWLAREHQIALMGIVDFDVLDGVDEFLDACELLDVRGSAGLETRVFIPEFDSREINSPGEPGVLYHMGMGFTATAAPAAAQSILHDLKQQSAERNLGMIGRINEYLNEVKLDYENDVLPLTPAGNATERHIVAAYVDKAASAVAKPAEFWAAKLGLSAQDVATLQHDLPAFQNAIRAKLMKKGGVGYVQPGPETFPPVEVVHELIAACGAIPCITWLDGTSAGEQAIEELFTLLIDKGACALNIVPDRNWNIADPQRKKIKLENLYAVVALAEECDLPLNVGTEMNAYGQRVIDDFDAPELAPVRTAFLDGAHFAYGHTTMQRKRGMGYASDWARRHFDSRAARNRFFTALGKATPPGKMGTALLAAVTDAMTPAAVLESVQND